MDIPIGGMGFCLGVPCQVLCVSMGKRGLQMAASQGTFTAWPEIGVIDMPDRFP